MYNDDEETSYHFMNDNRMKSGRKTQSSNYSSNRNGNIQRNKLIQKNEYIEIQRRIHELRMEKKLFQNGVMEGRNSD